MKKDVLIFVQAGISSIKDICHLDTAQPSA